MKLEKMQKHSGEHKMEVSVIEVDQCSWRRKERNGRGVCIMGVLTVSVHSIACRKLREFDYYWE